MVPELTGSEACWENGRSSSDLREGQTKVAVTARFTVVSCWVSVLLNVGMQTMQKHNLALQAQQNLQKVK